MNLIDRYLNEIGRRLPRANRADVLAEIRSLLMDTLEARVAGEPNEEDVVGLLVEFGPPEKVAASYSSQGQYLVGPTLYPLFRMVAGIVVAAVVGAQLLALALQAWWLGGGLNAWETLASIVASIPASLGMVVIVFAVLQRLDVRPDLEDKPWDPRSLPEIEALEPIKRGEQIFGIAGAAVLLAILAFFPGIIGFINHPGGQFYSNPVILQHAGWIAASLAAGMALNVYLLWQGRWSNASRVAQLAVSLLGIAVLTLLLQGHNAWLAERGAGSALNSLLQFTTDLENNPQLFGMQAFRLAFGVALVVTVIDTVLEVYRLLRARLQGAGTPGVLKA